MTNVPSRMKALQLTGFGPAQETLKYTEEAEVPKLSRGTDLLVHVEAAGVNPVEAKFRAGNFPYPGSPPLVLGGDYAGIVIQKGDQVKDYEVGDAVFGSLSFPLGPQGSYAEYIVVNPGKDGVAKKPEHMSFEEAAAVGIAATTAYQGIVDHGNLPSNGRVVVIGASGGVGTYAVQVGKAKGAYVIAICSGKNAALVASLGADQVVDYTKPEEMDELVKNNKETVDVVFDAVGGDDYYYKLGPLLKKKGVYSTAVGPVQHFGARKLSMFEYAKMILFTGIPRMLFGVHTYRFMLGASWDKFAATVQPLFASNAVKSIVPQDQIYMLEDGAKAHEKLETHRAVGKVVLRIS
ncbi:hypothetical protein VTP01DRAFT_3017 [Rhizomucor pusillus]|uniref:uncharacterized protein n=1 Tax=Rhizomucor pusillus TaxID=4840 RepID=UPI003743FB2A